MFDYSGEPGSVRMIRHGNELARKYEASLSTWYRNTDDSIEDDLRRTYYRDQYNLTSFADIVETLLATYDIFGRVY